MDGSTQRLIWYGDLRRICSGLGWLSYGALEKDLKKIIQWYLNNEGGWQPPFYYSGANHWLVTKS